MENLPFADERILTYVTDFLQQAHAADERYTVRDGINIGRFAIKLKSLATERAHETGALETAILETLGEEALRYAGRNRKWGRGEGYLICPMPPVCGGGASPYLPGGTGTDGVRH